MNLLNEKVMLRLLIFFVIFYGNCCVNCSISIPPADHHHVNNIISKDEGNKNTAIPEATLHDPPQIIIIQHEPTQNTKNGVVRKEQSAEINTPMKISIPFGHNKKVLTSIVHPLPRTMHDMMPREPSYPALLHHKKAHDDFLKHEVPKLQKKLHHHHTVEELRQRRKELKEKWQARHNKLSHVTPLGLHDKNEQHLKSKEKHREINRVMEIHATVSNNSTESVAKTENLLDDKRENLRKNIVDMYDQVTPRTRRILVHTEEEPQSLETEPASSQPSKIQHRFSKKTLYRKTSPTSPPINDYTESTHPKNQPEVVQLNSAKRSVPPEGPPKSSIEHTTESHFNLADLNIYPVLPDPQIAPVYFWPSATSEYTPHSSSDSSAKSFTSTKTTDSISSTEKSTTENYSKILLDQVALLNRGDVFEFHSGARSVAGRLTTEVPVASKDDVASVKIGTPKTVSEIEASLHQKPVFNYDKSAEEVGNSIEVHTDMESQDKIPIRKSLIPDKSSEEVGDSIDVHPGIENEQVTIPIDTPPYYRNLTYEEKILIQKPIFLGKSAEEVEDSNDAHLGIDHKQVTVPIDSRPSNRNLPHEKKAKKPLLHSKSEDELVEDSIDVRFGEQNNQVTKPIDSPSYKKKIEKPLLQGKSSEEVGDSIDVHPGIENKQVTVPIDDNQSFTNQKPGKSAEEIGTAQKTVKKGKTVLIAKQSQFVNSTTEDYTIKIPEEPQVNQDWRDHLREAVKERLRKLRRDSAEISLL